MTTPISPPAVDGRSTAVAEFLDKLRTTAPARPAGRGRLIFALDATASRQPTWDHACRVQGDVFEATASLGGIDLQLAFFRGRDECKASRWMTTAAELHRVMSAVTCLAGETQIERILTHALRETRRAPISGLVFVGDAMEERLDRLARHAGELGALGVPVFVFHEGTDPAAAAAFRQIADLSHGAYLAFDLAGIDRLKELLGAVAVFAAGGHQALSLYSETHGAAVLQLTHQLASRKGRC